jgi:Transglycosylase-like domain
LSVDIPRTSVRALLAACSVVLLAVLMAGSTDAAASSGGVSPSGGTASESSSGGDLNLTPERYQRLWDRVSEADKRWARRVSWCESGRDPNATALGGEYRGAFMFTWDAWKTSPKSPGGDPIDYSYVTQAVVAVALKARDGTRPWPECG